MTDATVALSGASTTTPTMISRIKTKIARRRVMKATIRDLNALSDHELNDIGIYRGMIRGIAMQQADTVQA